jgi:phosphoserine phosphatase
VKWGLDYYYGSDYEVINGVFTGKITNYISADHKILCLQDYCKNNSTVASLLQSIAARMYEKKLCMQLILMI